MKRITTLYAGIDHIFHVKRANFWYFPCGGFRTVHHHHLAAACNYSESQFNRVFRNIMGSSPRRYVLRHRIKAAKDLLARTDLTLSHIASRTGFYDPSDFGKRFREQEGMTPRKYRMKLRSMIRTGK